MTDAKTNTFENDLLKLIFQNIALGDIGDASGLQPSAAAGNLYISLHTADPGEDGTQTTNEVTYTGYARQAVVRSASGWTVSGNNASNAALISFPQSTSGTPTVTHISIGTDLTGTGNVLYRIDLASSVVFVENQTTLQFAIGEIDINEE